MRTHVAVVIVQLSQLLLLRRTFASELVYHTIDGQREVLRSLHSTYPKLTRLETLGRINSNPVYVLVVSKNGKRRFMIPRVHLLADFPAGGELLIELGSYILREYGRNITITKLVDSTEIHLLPSLVAVTVNKTSNEDCSEDDKPPRFGAFPDYFGDNDVENRARSKLTPETKLLVQWLRRGRFVLGGHLKGGEGDLVAAYGFHNGPDGANVSVAPDQDSLAHLAITYAANHPRMKYGAPQCPGGHLGGFPGGVTSAFAWKKRSGLMQDYAYVYEGTLIVTLAVSCCRIPHQTQLRKLWNENLNSLVTFLSEAHYGVRGYVKSPDGSHVPGAVLAIKGRNVAFKSSEQGEFWRILLPGAYKLLVSASGFLPAIVQFSVPETQRIVPLLVVNLTRSYRPVRVLSADSYTTQEAVPERRGSRNGALIRSWSAFLAAASLLVLSNTGSPSTYSFGAIFGMIWILPVIF